MKDKDSLILLLLLLAWFWFISPKKSKATASTNQPDIFGSGVGTTADVLGSAVQGGVDLGTAILNLGSTQTANLVNSIRGTGGAGTSGTSGMGNSPSTEKGGYSPVLTPGTADNAPVSSGQPGYTPFNANPAPGVASIVFIPSGPSDPWQGGYDLIRYADNSIAQQQHVIGQFSSGLYTPQLDSSGQPIPEVVPGVGMIG